MANTMTDSASDDGQHDSMSLSAIILFSGLHVDITLLFLYTSVDKLVTGGLNANKQVTDCSNAELLSSGLTLVLVFLIILFRHILPYGFVKGSFKWRVLRCFFVESALMSFHYRPVSCLVKSDYFYIFSLLQGGWQGFLFVLACVVFARKVQWRSIFFEDSPPIVLNDSMEASVITASAVASSGAAMPLTTLTTNTQTGQSSRVKTGPTRKTETETQASTTLRGQVQGQTVLAHARKLGLGGVMRGNFSVESSESDEEILLPGHVGTSPSHTVQAWRNTDTPISHHSVDKTHGSRRSPRDRQSSSSRPSAAGLHRGKKKIAPAYASNVDEMDI
eukprot:scpid67782/ scgid29972/ 